MTCEDIKVDIELLPTTVIIPYQPGSGSSISMGWNTINQSIVVRHGTVVMHTAESCYNSLLPADMC